MKFELEVIRFNLNDVVTASGEQGGGSGVEGSGDCTPNPMNMPIVA